MRPLAAGSFSLGAVDCYHYKAAAPFRFFLFACPWAKRPRLFFVTPPLKRLVVRLPRATIMICVAFGPRSRGWDYGKGGAMGRLGHDSRLQPYILKADDVIFGYVRSLFFGYGYSLLPVTTLWWFGFHSVGFNMMGRCLNFENWA
ncbi:hypothetical protein L6452_36125 [Arctium lappa]|uniref:Uncharacterized protein n=1 Tax=Arctium lappa TaxID=4217 RepID=A0ACB8Y8I4_ARCLA|nr:hypothetical protein L6452_36125 [Arctium lappa]